MARVALVTGGTRGIGLAIVDRLKQDGFKVAAGYAGNEDAAKKAAAEHGVMIVKGNVGDFADATRAVKEVEAELGPIDVLVNKRRHHPRRHAAQDDAGAVNEVIFVNLARSST